MVRRQRPFDQTSSSFYYFSIFSSVCDGLFASVVCCCFDRLTGRNLLLLNPLPSGILLSSGVDASVRRATRFAMLHINTTTHCRVLSRSILSLLNSALFISTYFCACIAGSRKLQPYGSAEVAHPLILGRLWTEFIQFTHFFLLVRYMS